MTTAERLISEFPAVTFPQQQKLETEIRELAVKTAALNCYDRVWAFYDGSKITKTRDGFVAE